MSPNFSGYRIAFKIFLFAFIFLSILNTQNVFAQLGGDTYTEDVTGGDLPTAPVSNFSTEDGGTNIFLQSGTSARDDIKKPVQFSGNPQQKSPAQVSNGKLTGIYEGSVLSCPYSFERDLNIGSKGEDVRLLQVLLNSDRRTMIAVSGPGSFGKETTSFGAATKEAVKKFQALFIEYVGIANGNFGPRTRTVMNAICNGENSSPKSGEMYNNVENVQFQTTGPVSNASPKGVITEVPSDKIAPEIRLVANVNKIKIGNTFKIIVNASEEIKAFTPEVFILEGGEIKEVRKLSKTSFSVTVTPSEEAKVVSAQIEADKIKDMSGNLNENASNEIVIKIVTGTEVEKMKEGEPTVDDLVKKIVASAPQCNYDNQGKLISTNPVTGEQVNTTGCAQTNMNNVEAVYDQTNRCYANTGKLPTGIQESQRCNAVQAAAQAAANNPNNPCSVQYQQNFYQQQQQAVSFYGYFSQPIQNPCQNPQAVAAGQQAALQQAQAARAAQQQGSFIGDMLRKAGFGNQSPANGPVYNGPPYRDTSTGDTSTAPSATRAKEIADQICKVAEARGNPNDPACVKARQIADDAFKKELDQELAKELDKRIEDELDLEELINKTDCRKLQSADRRQECFDTLTFVKCDTSTYEKAEAAKASTPKTLNDLLITEESSKGFTKEYEDKTDIKCIKYLMEDGTSATFKPSNVNIFLGTSLGISDQIKLITSKEQHNFVKQDYHFCSVLKPNSIKKAKSITEYPDHNCLSQTFNTRKFTDDSRVYILNPDFKIDFKR